MSKTHVPAKVRRQVVQDFENRCAYCHSPEFLLDGVYAIDHIVLEAAGGSTDRDNLCYTCILCNGHKGTKRHGVDPSTGLRIRLFHPRRQQWKRHFAWSVDGLQVEGRTQCGRATVVALQLNNPSLIRMRTFWQELGAMPPEWKRGMSNRAIGY